ncbi:MAG TPA: hypothetical protein VGI19_03260 [Candidatus Cybelea sp.]|jgi:hypothetical protein
MFTSRAARMVRALGASGLLPLMAACGGAAPAPAVGLAPTRLQAVESSKVSPNVVGSAGGKSWMTSHAKGPLLYISDSVVNVVLVFTWPKLRLIGNLSGLHQPQGECVDASSKVWIANTNRSEMLEFAAAQN